ncbi:16S rRNA (uracil(1498)-N(3))-methyltransferase [bacterium]|nr:16S rRNA (uracil(1498)-N(3))-methyltransferase [bacterium]
MNRFFLPPECFKNQHVQFPDGVVHQLRHVLRMTAGDVVEVLDNSGRVFLVVLESTTSDPLMGQVESVRVAEREPQTRLRLYFGLTSRDKVEWILQKGTEVGVARFSPFISTRTLAQDTRLTEKKTARWRRIIKEAAEQSRRGRLPVLDRPQSFADFLFELQSSETPALLAWEDAERGQTLKQALTGFPAESLALIVGPEGGFSEEEVQHAKVAGCRIVSLGRRILRMETAAIVMPALVLFELNN